MTWQLALIPASPREHGHDKPFRLGWMLCLLAMKPVGLRKYCRAGASSWAEVTGQIHPQQLLMKRLVPVSPYNAAWVCTEKSQENRIYLPKPNCRVIKVQGGMLWGLPRAGKPMRLFAEAGFSEESEGTGTWRHMRAGGQRLAPRTGR